MSFTISQIATALSDEIRHILPFQVFDECNGNQILFKTRTIVGDIVVATVVCADEYIAIFGSSDDFDLGHIRYFYEDPDVIERICARLPDIIKLNYCRYTTFCNERYIAYYNERYGGRINDKSVSDG